MSKTLWQLGFLIFFNIKFASIFVFPQIILDHPEIAVSSLILLIMLIQCMTVLPIYW